MLTRKKRAFAEALMSGENQTESAITAGYSEKAAKQAGYKLARDKDVNDYIVRKKNTPIEQKTSNNIYSKDDFKESLMVTSQKYNDPLVYLMKVMNDSVEDPKLRLDAAKALMPYSHPKIGENNKKESKQKKAESAASGRFSPAQPPVKHLN